MIPDISELKGKLVEMHGSPDAETTKQMIAYIQEMQEKHDCLTCYYDIRGELSRAIPEDSKFFEKVWVSPTLSGGILQEKLMHVAQYVDLIVIDDITYFEGDMWRLLSSLRKLAENTHTAIFLLNQRRFVKNHITQEYEDLPYRYNIIQKYCSHSIDADTGEVSLLESKESRYDSFVEFLLKAE